MSGAARAEAARATTALALAGLAAFAIAARVAPARPLVRPSSEAVHLLGADAFFHVRHAGLIAADFPHVVREDRATRYPRGDGAASAGLFPVVIAGIALALSGDAEAAQDRIAAVAAWLPPLLAALAMLALFGLARPWLGAGGALLACALFALHPGGSLTRTLYGFADQHAAEIALSLLWPAGLVRALRRSAGEPLGWWSRRPDLASSLPLALLVFTWLGAGLDVALAFAAGSAVLLVELARGERGMAALGCWRFGCGLLVWIGLVVLLEPSWVMHSRRLAEASALAAALAVLPSLAATCAAACGRRTGGLLAAAAILALPAALGLLAPAVRVEIVALLAQRTPLVAEHAAIGPAAWWSLLGVVLPLALLGVAAACSALARRRAPSWVAAPLVVAVAISALVLRVHDYDYLVPGFGALFAAAAGSALVRAAAHRPAWRAAAILALIGASGLPLGGFAAVARPWPSAADVAALEQVDDAWRDGLAWLRANAPPVRASDGAPAYGVAAPWPMGHAVAALSGLAPVWSHGASAEEGAFWVEEDEDRSLAALCPACRAGERVRYVIVDANISAQDFRARIQAADRDPRAYLRATAAGELAGRRVPLLRYGEHHERSLALRLAEGDPRAFRHYRLVYESQQQRCVAYRVWIDPPSSEWIEHTRDGVEVRAARRAVPVRTSADRERCVDRNPTRDGDFLVHGSRLIPALRIYEVEPVLAGSTAARVAARDSR